MIVGDLFSGIGGFSLAAEWMGWRTAWFSEIDPFASRVLAHHWPDVPNHGDITRIDWTTVEPVDVLTGGFPCQPHSLAGKRLASSDERDLFSEIIRAVRVLRPRFIVLENVRGLLTSESGRFFGRVLGSLADVGYDAEWRVLSAADVGAPHKRARVWITARLADAEGIDGRGEQPTRITRGGWAGLAGSGERMGDTERQGESQLCGVQSDQRRRIGDASDGMEHPEQSRPQGHARNGGNGHEPRRERAGSAGSVASSILPVGWADAIPVRGANGTVRRIPADAATCGPESALWPVAYGIPARVAQLRGIGNSIVPQCALEIFRTIDAMTRQERAA